MWNLMELMKLKEFFLEIKFYYSFSCIFRIVTLFYNQQTETK